MGKWLAPITEGLWRAPSPNAYHAWPYIDWQSNNMIVTPVMYVWEVVYHGHRKGTHAVYFVYIPCPWSTTSQNKHSHLELPACKAELANQSLCCYDNIFVSLNQVSVDISFWSQFRVHPGARLVVSSSLFCWLVFAFFTALLSLEIMLLCCLLAVLCITSLVRHNAPSRLP